MQSFELIRPESVKDAIGAQSERSAYIGGGTTLVDLMKLGVMQPDHVVDTNRLGLDEIEVLDDGRLKIGARVSNSRLATDARVERDYPVLSQALLSGASTGLRNMATTAGNVMQRTRCPYFRDPAKPCNKREPGTGCSAMDGINRNHAVLGTSEHCIATHPSDMCVAMAAIGATVVVEGRKGTREIPFEDFHLLPGDHPEREHDLRSDELITHVVLDAPLEGAVSTYLKLRDRASYEFALASCAAIVTLEGTKVTAARIALGGVATKPWRAVDAEAALVGEDATAKMFEQVALLAFQRAIPLEHNAFKVELGQQAIARALRDAVQQASQGEHQ
ncbi:FAD binding domain-containing protein [Larsenimonas suaedae]|uniref:Xanthine dehydrogenase family protein subunit M n=1 Tax=Larsenimonas suaedae TaxID=1851019 RepID=A0ABU1GSL2_9GAMM|nr:xanthine dehydrogenase family protein subunit M [Larsenimonas suaedae]MCM2972384.1 xanthine dehydrogenase family protein subunit M [Larsenimonas suaedae]MDR5894820.1 xanthine dehydrogenase family protein subunit M [Larsenimonas suaedae]